MNENSMQTPALPWYAHLPYNFITNRYVKVAYQQSPHEVTSYLYGRPSLGDGGIFLTFGEAEVKILKSDNARGEWVLADQVKSVESLWRISEYIQVPPTEAQDGDIAVYSGRQGVVITDEEEVSDDLGMIPRNVADYVLRKRPKPPTEPGLYLDHINNRIYYLGVDQWRVWSESQRFFVPVSYSAVEARQPFDKADINTLLEH